MTKRAFFLLMGAHGILQSLPYTGMSVAHPSSDVYVHCLTDFRQRNSDVCVIFFSIFVPLVNLKRVLKNISLLCFCVHSTLIALKT